jgi:creatinine deaminase
VWHKVPKLLDLGFTSVSCLTGECSQWNNQSVDRGIPAKTHFSAFASLDKMWHRGAPTARASALGMPLRILRPRHKERTMKPFIAVETIVSDEVLGAIACLPTKSLSELVDPGFFRKLSDRDFMRVAFVLARKSYDEGGSPIGAVIIHNATRQILGKGHNTLVQENHPYNHGETSAVRDAGRIDFSETTLFTSLSPCDICAALIYMRQFRRVVVGDVTNDSGNEDLLRQKGIQVDILEDPESVALYAKYRREKPDQDLEDWKGLAAVRRASR